jgi:2-haloalkanoic acid dehalogenase type II
MRLTDFKVLSLGYYGTLIDRESGLYTALRPLLATARLKLDRQQAVAAFTRHESAQQAEAPGMRYSEVLVQAHCRLAREWGALCSDDEHALFAKSVPSWPPFADAPAGLQYLRRYFRLAVLSNADRTSLAASSRHLEVRFETVFTAEEIGSYKPDPRNFEYLAGRLGALGFKRTEILHTAGSLVRDHAPARSCGLATAWIDRVRPESTGELEGADGVGFDFRFRSIADMVKAHQEELRA